MAYINIDKAKTAPVGDIVAVISANKKAVASRVVFVKNTYYSKTAQKTLAERIDGGEKTKA